MSNYNYCCRKATLCDDTRKIAEYIHLTDPFIYPKITLNPGDNEWVQFISNCLTKKNNIFYIGNISVVMCDCDIIGVACVIPCQKELTITKDIELLPTISDNIQPVIEGYFAPLIEESYLYSGYNIVNICIDEKHRNKGLGSLLMTHCIEEYGAQTIHLDVIASNENAIKLYKNFGFEIKNEYMGFSGDSTLLPCYHMIREK